jgi:hypothetical protein
VGLAAAVARTPRWHGWRRPLSRRNQKGDFNWERMTKLADDQLRNRGSFTLGRASDSPSSTRGKSRMHKGARTDLCGGRGATRVRDTTIGHSPEGGKNVDMTTSSVSSGRAAVIEAAFLRSDCASTSYPKTMSISVSA